MTNKILRVTCEINIRVSARMYIYEGINDFVLRFIKNIKIIQFSHFLITFYGEWVDRSVPIRT